MLLIITITIAPRLSFFDRRTSSKLMIRSAQNDPLSNERSALRIKENCFNVTPLSVTQMSGGGGQ